MSGGAGAIVHLGILYVLVHLFAMWYLIATSLAFLVAVGVSFTLQKFWTFQNTATAQLHTQGIAFLLVSTANFFINGLCMYLLVDGVHLPPIVAQFITSALIAIEAFVVYSFIFRSKHEPTEPMSGSFSSNNDVIHSQLER